MFELTQQRESTTSCYCRASPRQYTKISSYNIKSNKHVSARNLSAHRFVHLVPHSTKTYTLMLTYRSSFQASTRLRSSRTGFMFLRDSHCRLLQACLSIRRYGRWSLTMCRISPRSCEVSVTGFHYLVKGQSVPFSGGLSPNQEDCPLVFHFFSFLLDWFRRWRWWFYRVTWELHRKRYTRW